MKKRLIEKSLDLGPWLYEWNEKVNKKRILLYKISLKDDETMKTPTVVCDSVKIQPMHCAVKN